MTIGITRRTAITGAAGASLALAFGSRIAFAAENRVDLVSAADSNITDWLTNSLKPMFEAANPGYELNVIAASGTGGGVEAIADRAYAALQAKKDPQVDFFEEFDPRLPPGPESGLWTKFSASEIKNYDHLNKVAIDTAYGLPWRGSQVVLAYDSDKVPQASVPKTWEQLTAWIVANPGQFIYGRPDRGGSGRNFVVRAVHEANGRDPKQFAADNFSKAEAEAKFPAAWKILRDLAPNLYQGGAYTAGNTPTLQLLISGTVSMVPAWSDQALQGLTQGVIPPSVRLVQLTDLAFCGQFSQACIPTNSAHHDAAMKLANMVLTDEVQAAIVKDLGGFPAVALDRMPKDLQAELADVIPNSIPVFPEGDWESALNDGWYRNVAPTLNPADN